MDSGLAEAAVGPPYSGNSSGSVMMAETAKRAGQLGARADDNGQHMARIELLQSEVSIFCAE